MTPTLIVLALLALGVAIVAFATRRKPGDTPRPQTDQDTAWNDPITPANEVHPFAHAPEPTPVDLAPAQPSVEAPR
ncbi:MAG: hypothetical protein V4701_06075 [Pseudomonadota bacterium]